MTKWLLLLGWAYATMGCVAGAEPVDSSDSETQGAEALAPSPPPIHVTSTWHCKGPMNHQEVFVDIDAPGAHEDAIHLDEGCTGSLIVHVTTNSADGMKVHDGAHDLRVKGDITCTAKYGEVHQDGVQAMGGSKVTLGGSKPGAFRVDCPTGNNGGLFVNAGRGGNGTPSDIVCDHCDLREGNAALHVGPDSLRSGARNSVLHRGTGEAAPENCRRIDHAAVDPVDEGNTCVD
jgi:hypothetical protein